MKSLAHGPNRQELTGRPLQAALSAEIHTVNDHESPKAPLLKSDTITNSRGPLSDALMKPKTSCTGVLLIRRKRHRATDLKVHHP
ncbi:MAG: hypothetical protein R3C01_16790 [Planctomycetaceae bacterium]